MSRLAAVTACAVIALWTSRAEAALSSGQLLTNFASATFSLPTGIGRFALPPPDLAYSMTAWVLITDEPTFLRVSKYASPALVGSGAVVSYSINLEVRQPGPVDSVWNVTVTDRLPANTVFMDWGLNDYNTTLPSPGSSIAAQSSSLAGSWSGASPSGQAAPYYLRWVVPCIGPGRSASVTYRAMVL